MTTTPSSFLFSFSSLSSSSYSSASASSSFPSSSLSSSSSSSSPSLSSSLTSFIQIFSLEFLQIYLPIGVYYAIGLAIFHGGLDWSLIDSISITTASMTAGRDLFNEKPAIRMFISLFTVIGVLIMLNLLSSFIIAEVRSARDLTTKKSIVSQFPIEELSKKSVYIRRLFFPLLHVTLVLLVGTIFFAFSENWSFTDASYYCIVLRSITGSDGDLRAQRFSSKFFLIFYQWVFITSIMNIISSLCALRVEMTEIMSFEMKMQRAQNISTLALEPSYFSGDNIDQFEFLVKLLIHLDVLDRENDVDKWLGTINEICRNQSGRLTRGDILAFAESYRRRLLHPVPSPHNPIPQSQEKKERTANSSSNLIPPPPLPHPPHVQQSQQMSQPQQISDERTPLLPLPIEHSHVSHPHIPLSMSLMKRGSLTDSSSPLTLGKKSSYGLFLPQSLRGSVMSHLSYEEEEEAANAEGIYMI